MGVVGVVGLGAVLGELRCRGSALSEVEESDEQVQLVRGGHALMLVQFTQGEVELASVNVSFHLPNSHFRLRSRALTTGQLTRL